MQLFANEGKEDNKVSVGNIEIKVKKASSLQEGTHPARFYPLSPQFHDGADFISIVQHVHWLNRQPCICRRTSYDYNVPDTQDKPLIDNSCVICNDKFAWFKQGKALKESNPTEAEKLKQIGKDLMEKISASSIVSLIDVNGNLTPPVILRYGKELLDQLQLHAYRIEQSSGVHICDPAKGYMFDIVVGKNDGGFRTYKNSMPSVDSSPVDITGAPWKWNEICEAIRSEIMPILSPEDVHSFYLANYGGNASQTFVHPAFQNNGGGNQNNNSGGGFTPPANNQNNNGGGFTPPANNNNGGGFTPPAGNQNNNGGGFTPPADNAAKSNAPTFTPPVDENKAGSTSSLNSAGTQTKTAPAFTAPDNNAVKLYPCHSKSPGGSGYEQSDSNCKACPQAKECYESFNTNTAPEVQETPNAGNANNAPAFDHNNVQGRLDVLTNKMG